ncbi:MAG: hypothetical protein GY697_11945 [Desulfobacterales bacterium]|nr:hypothetical protein [Desulfobacterales bacterium]
MFRWYAIFQTCLILFTAYGYCDDVLVPVDDYPPWKIVTGKSVTGDQKIEVYFAVSRKSKLYEKRHILEGELHKMVDAGIAARIIEDFFK